MADNLFNRCELAYLFNVNTDTVYEDLRIKVDKKLAKLFGKHPSFAGSIFGNFFEPFIKKKGKRYCIKDIESILKKAKIQIPAKILVQDHLKINKCNDHYYFEKNSHCNNSTAYYLRLYIEPSMDI